MDSDDQQYDDDRMQYEREQFEQGYMYVAASPSSTTWGKSLSIPAALFNMFAVRPTFDTSVDANLLRVYRGSMADPHFGMQGASMEWDPERWCHKMEGTAVREYIADVIEMMRQASATMCGMFAKEGLTHAAKVMSDISNKLSTLDNSNTLDRWMYPAVQGHSWTEMK